MEFIDRVSSDDLSEKKVLEEEQSKGLTIAVTNLAQDLSGSNLGSSFVSCSFRLSSHNLAICSSCDVR